MTFLRYTMIQILAYAIDMGSFLLLLHFGLFGPIAANIFAKLAAGGFAFVAHRHFTFAVAGSAHIKRQAIAYFLLLASNVPIGSAVLAVVLHWLPEPALAKIISDVVCVALTYVLSKYFVFNVESIRSTRAVPDTKL